MSFIMKKSEVKKTFGHQVLEEQKYPLDYHFADFPAR